MAMPTAEGGLGLPVISTFATAMGSKLLLFPL
jgi:hypothetical protein